MANNPFITNRYTSPEYFCDRQRETEAIIRLLTNGNNIALISPRRIGKPVCCTIALHDQRFRMSITPSSLTYIRLIRCVISSTFSARLFWMSCNEVVRIVYEKFDGITSYLQRIMNMLFTLTAANEKCTSPMIDTAINDLLDFSSDTYESLLYQMPEKQKEVFAAIVAEGNVKNISGGTFVRVSYYLVLP